ncbi:MAG: hypothetical protein HY204_11870 [Nitrospirae bacterium]|nr:hypothetical protein [Nitrospirota bacterium]
MRFHVYAGLFMISLSTLMFEILLTRIFSVVTWYHFAFLAISIAMFGLAVGAIWVYLCPNYFRKELTNYHLGLSGLLFSVTIVLSFLAFIEIQIKSAESSLLAFGIVSVPFVFGGICVCLALTRFPQNVGRLYAADLAGAATGCVLLIPVVDIAGGPTAVFVVALIGAGAAFLFTRRTEFKKLGLAALVWSIVLAAFVLIHADLVQKQSPWVQLKWVKGKKEGPALYEKWNSYSRIRVSGNLEKPEKPYGWGLSPTYDRRETVRQIGLYMDANAYTVITAFDGDLTKLDYLKYDIINMAHYLRKDGRVLVIGIGGGRDVLSALAFKQKSIVGVEINEDIIKTVNEKFGDFTGHLNTHPNVIFVNDEARSYVERSKDEYDIIQASLIDTFAASTSGAFALTENSLYTIEAWDTFIHHLSSEGILTFSRWYAKEEFPVDSVRLVALASAALKRVGIEQPQQHLVMVTCMVCPVQRSGVGTLLLSKRPFLDSELDTIERLSAELQFDIVQSPRRSINPLLSAIAAAEGPTRFEENNISAPTDDSPFFFNFNFLRGGFSAIGRTGAYQSPVIILATVLVSVFLLTFLCMIIPLVLTTEKKALSGAWPFFIFFGAIGSGFMLIEMSQLQRLIIFLGHPTYALSVVLFALLLSTGIGSYFTQKTSDSALRGSAVLGLLILLCVLFLFGVGTPHAVGAFRGSPTPVRILVATGILIPIGMVMGLAFPFGIRLASINKLSKITPWFWGINGATSVCASVLAVAIALSFGISAAFWTGFLFYAAALPAFLWASRVGATPNKKMETLP